MRASPKANIVTSSSQYTPKRESTSAIWLVGDKYVSGTWADRISASNNFTEATNRPTVSAGAINGHSAVAFNGVSQKLTGPATSTLITASAWSLFIVFKADIITQNNASAWTNDTLMAATDSNWGVHLKSTGPTLQSYAWDGAAKVAGLTIAAGVWYLLETRHDTGNLYAKTRTIAEVTAACGNSTVGGSLALGLTNQPFTGKIAEIVGGAYDAGARSRVRQYLQHKYPGAI